MIAFCHLLNDRSGSPRVLREVVAALSPDGSGNRLFVAASGPGPLDAAPVPVTTYPYRRGTTRLGTLLQWVRSQIALVDVLARAGLPADAVVYVNTLLPAGAAIWGRITGRPVVYHLHEVSISPPAFQRLLVTVARRTASRLIYVSDAHRALLPIAGVRSAVVPNAIPEGLRRAGASTPYAPRRSGTFRVLMLASLRDYKGVPEFLALARSFSGRPDLTFALVLNGTAPEIARLRAGAVDLARLEVEPAAEDVAPFFRSADVVLNLSRPDRWIETFGLTLVEAMAFGVPVIAPPVGGPAEIVRDGVEGFLIDSRDGAALARAVARLADDPDLCRRLSEAARRRSNDYLSANLAERLGAQVAGLAAGQPRTVG